MDVNVTKEAKVSAEETKHNTREYVFIPWSIQSQVDPRPIVRGEGCWFYDADGNAYLDFYSQHVCVSLGYGHPKMVAAITEQVKRLCYTSPMNANDTRSKLAKMIAEIAPGDLKKTLFTLGGADANENAIKCSRWYTGKRKIITRFRSYHGASHGALSLGGDNRRWASEPAIPGIVRVPDPYCYRCSFGQRPESCDLECLKYIEEVILYEGPEYIAAIFIEPITGVSGMIIPPKDYLPRLRSLCDKYDILLVCDEVMVGFGRTGEWFAVDHWDVVPDIITFAKGCNGGYLPLGGVIISEKIDNYFDDHMYWGGLTYSGHPMSCASMIAAIEIYKEEGLLENSKRLGAKLLDELNSLKGNHPSIGDVRGLGLFAGLELVKNRETREPLVPWQAPGTALTGGMGPMTEMLEAAMQKGVYLFGKWNMFFFAPPLTITEEELMQGIEVLDEVLAIADKSVT